MARLIFCFFFLLPALSFAECGIPGIQKRILAKSADGYTAVWEIPEGSALYRVYDFSGSAVRRHRAWVRSKTSWSSREILKNHLRVGREILSRLSPRDGGRASFLRGIAGTEKIINGEVGRIRPLNCLEAIPFAEMLKVLDLRRKPAEFQAKVFRRGSQLLVIGDFYRPNLGYIGVAESGAARSERLKLLSQGWSLEVHIHNHPFTFSSPSGDIGGVLGPSEADLALYHSLRPGLAVITNGIEVIELKPSDWKKF